MPTFGKLDSYVSTYTPGHFGETLWPSLLTHVNTHTFEDTRVLAKSRAAKQGLYLKKDLTEFSSFRPLSARARRRTWADQKRAKALGGNSWHRPYAAGVGTGARRVSTSGSGLLVEASSNSKLSLHQEQTSRSFSGARAQRPPPSFLSPSPPPSLSPGIRALLKDTVGRPRGTAEEPSADQTPQGWRELEGTSPDHGTFPGCGPAPSCP